MLGTRYVCSKCANVQLCTDCYDEERLRASSLSFQHQFIRASLPFTEGARLSRSFDCRGCSRCFVIADYASADTARRACEQHEAAAHDLRAAPATITTAAASNVIARSWSSAISTSAAAARAARSDPPP